MDTLLIVTIVILVTIFLILLIWSLVLQYKSYMTDKYHRPCTEGGKHNPYFRGFKEE